MLFVFGTISAPILSRLLSAWWDGYGAERDHFCPNVALITMSLLLAFWSFPDRLTLTRQMGCAKPGEGSGFYKNQPSSRTNVERLCPRMHI
jgi:hypothetical protein